MKRDNREIKFENIYDLGKPLINTCTILMKIKIRYIDLYIERGINIQKYKFFKKEKKNIGQ